MRIPPGVNIKIYFTLGQLSNHAIELFALAGLNGEILSQDPTDVPPAPGPGVLPHGAGPLGGMGGNLMGNEWLEEHMVRGYEGGWFTANPNWEEDASIGDDAHSRFMNYYISAQGYLYDHVGRSRRLCYVARVRLCHTEVGNLHAGVAEIAVKREKKENNVSN